MEEKKEITNKEEITLMELRQSISETSQINNIIRKLQQQIKDLDGKIAITKGSIQDEIQRTVDLKQLTNDRQQVVQELIKAEQTNAAFTTKQKNRIKGIEDKLARQNNITIGENINNGKKDETGKITPLDVSNLRVKKEEQTQQNKQLQHSKEKGKEDVEKKQGKRKKKKSEKKPEVETNKSIKNSESESQIKLEKENSQQEQKLQNIVQKESFQATPNTTNMNINDSNPFINTKQDNISAMVQILQNQFNQLNQRHEQQNGEIKQLREENIKVKEEVMELNKRMKDLENFNKEREIMILRSSLIEKVCYKIFSDDNDKTQLQLQANKYYSQDKDQINQFDTMQKKKVQEQADISSDELEILKKQNEYYKDYFHPSLSQIIQKKGLLLDEEHSSKEEIVTLEKCINFCVAEQK